ncbi:MAG: putative glycolipid-binding domain-containing protein [Candidatus Rokubacteria bacterium]|nr:putative glycolipid-binding domain-containing protein [Candidatus Rokubacteria bacterium]
MSQAGTTNNFYWQTLFAPGVEHLRLDEGDAAIVADGVMTVHADGGSFRVRCRIECDDAWRAWRVHARSTTGGAIELHADGAGHWTTAQGARLPALDGAIDVDIAACAYTNTLTIRRLALAAGASSTEAIAYIQIPSLDVERVTQRYTCLSRDDAGSAWRCENLTHPSRYDIRVDGRGIVHDYPAIFARLWPDGDATPLVVSGIVERDGDVLLLQRNATNDHAAGEWEPVSGRVEPGESPGEAVVREVREETGLDVELVAPVDTFRFLRGAARVPRVGIAFHCRVRGGSVVLSSEHDGARWVHRDALAACLHVPEGVREGLSRFCALSE